MSDMQRVYRVVWDGEPSMSGLPHVMSTHEFSSLDEATRALDMLDRRGGGERPNIRVQTRKVTEWVPYG
ncbi:MAG: hypothetical protein M3O41_00490 [Pseudomonadota bacterium]|nr:hypothetical protein [Pseudomonadota bacterium]